MQDWKGNEIKEGMTIVYIRVVDTQFESGVFFAGKYTRLTERSEKRCWERHGEYLVEMIGDRLGYRQITKDSGYTMTIIGYLDQYDPFLSAAPGEGFIIAIKGISDHNDILEKTDDLINKAMRR